MTGRGAVQAGIWAALCEYPLLGPYLLNQRRKGHRATGQETSQDSCAPVLAKRRFVGEQARDNVFKVLVRVDQESWLDTGIWVERGQRLEIHVEGAMPFGKGRVVKPGGDPADGLGAPESTRAKFPSYPLGSVVASIGGWEWCVGGRKIGYSEASGNLLLIVNDVPGYYGDNRGPFGQIAVYEVSVKVSG